MTSTKHQVIYDYYVADYTIKVKNIPMQLRVNYKDKLKEIFEIYSVPGSEQKIQVTKVFLVYDIDELKIKED